jgi:FkbH-like protein
MAQDQQRIDRLTAYVRADAGARAERFTEFTADLKDLAAADGKRCAWQWAKRAVSPFLDYSSLFKLRRFLPPEQAHEKALRLAILGGPTTTQLRQLIEVFLAAQGIAADIYEADYGLFRQEVFTPDSGLDRFRPQVIFLATSARDVTSFPDINSDEKAVANRAEEEAQGWLQLWETCRTRWNATVLQNNFEIAPAGVLGHYSVRHPAARENYLERLNRILARLAPAYVVLHDLRSLAAEAGARSWFDPRFYLEFKMPCGPMCLSGYAHSVASLLLAILGRSKKALVLDLDNTLWGGVVGDVGAGGIVLGQGSGEGEAFLAFQKYAKALQERGIVLAVCSKNDDAKAREPFEKREDMILKMSDISCFVANWENKADNLKRIAERLELKLDSFVFVDDNPAERAIVRQFVPEVEVPDLPEDPADYIQAVASHRFFETVGFTREDSERTRYYADNVRRRELASSATDLGAFLASLGMKMKVVPVNELNVERVTQLINKSNQFNLTTRRYTLAQVREMASSSEWRTLTFSLRDNLGDNGLISVILLHKHADWLSVDTWVMSCRVLQRGVEQFARNELVELARNEGCAGILGTYIPTAKNALVKDHFAGLGFETAGADGDETFWSLPLATVGQSHPHFIERDSTNE